MVCTLSPPGVSSARANSRRASAPCGLAALRCARRWRRRARHRRAWSSAERVEDALRHIGSGRLGEGDAEDFSGATPASSRLITRCASTRVLPEPALAATHAETPGSETSPCIAARQRMISANLIGRYHSRARCRHLAAGRRPFLDAREVVVIAVARLPHRMHQRAIGLVVIVEPPHQRRRASQAPDRPGCPACPP